MYIRGDVRELLAAGHSDAEIGRRLGVDRKSVARARSFLGLPKAKSGKRPAASPEALFWGRVQRVSGGHMRWTGARTPEGTAVFRHGGRERTAGRVAFRIAQGREPEGHVLPGCDRPGCVAPACQTDRRTRAEARKVDALYDRIFGTSA
ncbi:hypothetical protein [Streptomyces longwoodensis]|uniref:hypothetical protein n=1 Tax=Streptomyces longwoodensis TaxID=68231 RepID=UPI00224F5319|nr:hypothetical protein [Streptomyces longwoodensis]MCX4994292.1 hypothetical protein [Streptomyces longwoodensis]